MLVRLKFNYRRREKMNRSKIFENAIKEERNKSQFVGSEIEWTDLEKGSSIPFRIRGLPTVGREQGSDLKCIGVVNIRNMAGSFRSFVIEENEDVLRGPFTSMVKEYLNVVESSNNKEDANSSLYATVKYNNAPVHRRLFEKGWTTQRKLLVNVIDRRRMQDHREQKSCFALSKLISEKWTDLGVPYTIYRELIKLAETYGDWDQYDVLIKYTDSTPFYSVSQPPPSQLVGNDPLIKLAVIGPLTEEEQSWKLFNFDEIIKVSTPDEILKHIGSEIQQIDDFLGSHYYTQFGGSTNRVSPVAQQAPVENPLETASIPTVTTQPSTVTPDFPPANVTATVATPNTSANPDELSDADQAAFLDALETGKENGLRYTGIKHLTPEEKRMIVGVNDDFTPIYKLPDGMMLIVPPNGMVQVPECFTYDPLSGVKLEKGD